MQDKVRSFNLFVPVGLGGTCWDYAYSLER